METRDLTDTTTAAARGREFAAASLEGGRANHTFGRHIMLDLRRCDEGRLNSLENCFFILDVLPERIGMKKISAPHVFRYEAPDKSESGITGVTIIAESHISLHTFPKKRYAFVDVFSCKSFDGEPVVAFLKEFLLCEEYDVFSQNRGKGFSRNKI